MRAVGYEDFGGPEVMQVLEDLPEPRAGEGQVRIRVVASDVNNADRLNRSYSEASRAQLSPESRARQDQLIPRHDGVYILGFNAAGVIDQVGPGVDGFVLGEPVLGLVAPKLDEGAQAELVVVDVASVVRAPRGKTFVEASTLLMNALTARMGLDALGVSAGETIAVTGAAGAVGGFAVQLATKRGVRVIADAAEKDRELVQGLGADLVLGRGDGFAHAILAENGQVDGVLDAAMTNDSIYPAIADGRTIFSPLGHRGDTSRGVQWVWDAVADHISDTAALEELRDAAEDGTLTLRVADVFLPEQAADVHRLLEAGGFRGRLVFTF